MSYADDIVGASLREFSALQTYRAVFAQQWEEVSELVWPTYRNTFYVGSYNFPGLKKTDRQVDATAMIALGRFAAILNSLLTPQAQQWHYLTTDNEDLEKDREIKLYFEQVTRALFKARYKARANFQTSILQSYQSLGAFGTGVVFTDGYMGIDEMNVGLRYKGVPLGQMFLRENHQGQIDGFNRFMRMTRRQAIQAYGEKSLPEMILAAADGEQVYDFLHRVCPRDDYDPERLDEKGKLYGSYTIALQGNKLVREGGYSTFPICTTRYQTGPEEVYGRGPAMDVLPAIKTLNAEKRDFLTQGHRAGTPVLLTTEDGVVDFSMRPGALNKGGFADGKPQVGVLPSGDIQVTKEMMDEERSLIKESFLQDLFQLALETSKLPEMTATQVMERMNEKGMLLAPTVGRQQAELGVLIEREIDVLAQQHRLPPQPGLLREAKGEYHIIYTSPLSKAMRAGDAVGFQRYLQTAIQISQATGDPSPFDELDLNVALPDVADIYGMPERYRNSPEAKAAIRKARQDKEQRQEQVQAAPAAAALQKAEAAKAKAGLPVQQPQ